MKHNTEDNPTFEQMKKFLVKHYRHERLYGIDLISHHESVNGQVVWVQFVNGSIRRVGGDTARAALRRKPFADRGNQPCVSAGA